MDILFMIWFLGMIAAFCFVFWLIFDLAEPDPYNKKGKW